MTEQRAKGASASAAPAVPRWRATRTGTPRILERHRGRDRWRCRRNRNSVTTALLASSTSCSESPSAIRRPRDLVVSRSRKSNVRSISEKRLAPLSTRRSLRSPLRMAMDRDRGHVMGALLALGSPAANEIASRAVASGGGQLPYFDEIQRRFGRHDGSGVSAHQGSAVSQAASALGALAVRKRNQARRWVRSPRFQFVVAADVGTAEQP